MENQTNPKLLMTASALYEQEGLIYIRYNAPIEEKARVRRRLVVVPAPPSARSPNRSNTRGAQANIIPY